MSVLSELLIKIAAKADPSVGAAINQVKSEINRLSVSSSSSYSHINSSVEAMIANHKKVGEVAKTAAQSIDNSLNTALKNIRDRLHESSGEITDLASKATVGFSAIAIGSGLMVKSWTDASGQMEQYRAKLITVLKSTAEADKVLTDAVKIAAATPFDVKGVVDATAIIEVYGLKAKEVFPLAGDLAAGMSKDLEQTALSITKAMSGSYEGFERLRNEYGITTMKLKQFGAAVDKQGQLMLGTQKGVDSTREALTRIIQLNFGGAMERQMKTWKGSMSNLDDSIMKLKVSLGNELAPTLTSIARGITVAVEGFNQYGSVLKPVIAWGTVLVGSMAALAVPLMGLVAILPALSAGWQLINASIGASILVTNASTFSFATNTAGMVANQLVMKGYPPLIARVIGALAAMSGAFYATIGVIGLAAAAFAGYIKWLEEKNKKMEASVQADNKALISLRAVTREYSGKSVDEFKRMGLSAKDLAEDIKYMQAAMDKAFKAGDFKEAKMFQKAIIEAQKLKDELAVIDKKYEAASRAVKDIAVEVDIMKSTHAFKTTGDEVEYMNKKIAETQDEVAKFGIMSGQGMKMKFDLTDTKAAETRLRVFKSNLADLQKQMETSQTPEALKPQVEALKTLIDLIEKGIDAGKRLNQEKLEASKTYIDRQKELNQMSIDDEIKANERILATLEKGSKEYAEIQHRILVLKHDKQVQSKEKTEKTLQDELKAVKEMTTGQVKEYDKLIKKIEEYRKAGKITDKAAKEMTLTATNERTDQAKKDQEKLYKDMVDYQEHYLKEIENNEQMSVEDRIGYYDSLEKYWYEMERQRPEWTEKAEDQIMKIIEKRGALEKQIIQANKQAEQDLINLRKSALDNDIKKLQDKLKAGSDVEKELMRKIDDRMKLEMKAIELKDKELEKQGVGKNKREEISSRSQAALYEKQADELGAIISDLQAKLPEEQDRLKAMSMESLISRLQERKAGLESSYRSATGQAEAAQAAGGNEPMPETKTGFELPVADFGNYVGQFGDAIQRMLDAFNQGVKNGASIPNSINHATAVQNMTIPAAGSNSYYESQIMFNGQGITPPADMAARAAALQRSINEYQAQGYLNSVGLAQYTGGY